MQQVIVILIVAAAGVWLAWQAYRFFSPKPGGKACGGNCCDNDATPAQATEGKKVMMISSDDLRNRLKARKSQV